MIGGEGRSNEGKHDSNLATSSSVSLSSLTVHVAYNLRIVIAILRYAWARKAPSKQISRKLRSELKRNRAIRYAVKASREGGACMVIALDQTDGRPT